MEHRNRSPKHPDVFHSAGMDPSFKAKEEEEAMIPRVSLLSVKHETGVPGLF